MTPLPLAYRLKTKARNHCCDVMINDFPVDSFGRDIRTTDSENISQLVIEGENQLALAMTYFTCIDYQRDDTGRTLAPETSATVIASDQDGNDASELASVAWSGNPGIRGESITCCRSETTFNVPSHCGRWAWQDAEVLDITPTVRAEVVAVVTELHQAMHQGDPKPFYQAAEIRTRERIRAHPQGSTQRDQERIITLIDAQHSVGQWGLKPIEADRLILRPFGYGRVIQVLHEFEDHPIPGNPLRSTADSALGAMSFGLMLSRIDGAWHIVR